MANKRSVPVFIVNGFLESGKTTFITNALLRDPNIGPERVVIIRCEEGETEYENLPDNIHVWPVEDPDDYTTGLLERIRAKYNPTYVIVEYNVIWGMDTIHNTSLPDTWGFAEQMSVIDGRTFQGYFSNMKNFFSDMLRFSSRIFVNRCTRQDDFKFYKDSIRPMAPRGDLIYLSDEEGMLDITLEEDLPYDLNEDVIRIREDDYLTFYIDMLDNPDRYEGKTVEFVALGTVPAYFRDGYFLAGNTVMTCCEDDMQFLAFVCQYDQASFIKEGNYLKIRGQVHREYSPEYGEEGPVLYVSKTTSMPGMNKNKKKKK